MFSPKPLLTVTVIRKHHVLVTYTIVMYCLEYRDVFVFLNSSTEVKYTEKYLANG